MKTKLLLLLCAARLALGAETTAPAAAPVAACAHCADPAAPAVATGNFSRNSIYQLDAWFTNDAGKALALGELRGRPVVLDMFFASCGYACPLLVSDMQAIRAKLPAGIRKRAVFVLVSFDVDRDTPAALAKYRTQRALDGSWVLLHGNDDDVRELAALLGVKYKQEADGAFSHSNVLTILNPAGEIVHQRVGLKGGLDEAAAALVAAANSSRTRAMKPWRLLLLASLAGSAFAADATTFADAFANGKLSLNLRLRYEDVQQTGLQDGEALTLRTRLGFTTARWQGWQAMVEAEDIRAADRDSYSQAGLNPGGAGKAVIADPEATEINQSWLAYTVDQTTAKLGRQRLVLDNARFIGDSGWRQNMQTFDAFVLQDKSLPKTALTYAYLSQINRVYGPDHPQGKWLSDSHVLNASYAGWAAGMLTGYAYLLDFSNSAVNSCATYGASFAGATPLTPDLKFTYRAEAATQSDYRRSPLTYTAHYYAFEAGLALKSASLTLGDEVLGSDHNVGFKTPLATLHAFNGWADLFLTTPAAGLRDTYLRVTADLPGKVAFVGSYHQFHTDVGGLDLGDETDLQFSRKFSPRFTALVKFADFRRQSLAYPNVQKVWAQVEFAL